jgi:hypothetical protein
MIAIRLTYNGNVDWVYPFPLSFLQSCHSLGGVTVVLRGCRPARRNPDGSLGPGAMIFFFG